MCLVSSWIFFINTPCRNTAAPRSVDAGVLVVGGGRYLYVLTMFVRRRVIWGMGEIVSSGLFASWVWLERWLSRVNVLEKVVRREGVSGRGSLFVVGWSWGKAERRTLERRAGEGKVLSRVVGWPGGM